MTDGCPNPKCEDGYIGNPALLCPDCVREGRAGERTRQRFARDPRRPGTLHAVAPPPPISYPDAITSPVDPPSVEGTNVRRPI